MKTKIHSSELVKDALYWYIYQGGGKCQLLNVINDETLEKDIFQVVVDNGQKSFNSIPIKIDTDENGFYSNLFENIDKENAEIMWVYNFVKNFKDNTLVEYPNFLNLYSKLQNEYPDLVLKGL